MSVPIAQQLAGLDAIRAIVMTHGASRKSGVRPSELERHIEIIRAVEGTLEWVARHKPTIEAIMQERKGQGHHG